MLEKEGEALDGLMSEMSASLCSLWRLVLETQGDCQALNPYHGVFISGNIDGLVQERRNSIANALELRLDMNIHLHFWSFLNIAKVQVVGTQDQKTVSFILHNQCCGC